LKGKEELNDNRSGLDWNDTFGTVAYPHGFVIARALSNTLSPDGSPGAIGGYPFVDRQITIESGFCSCTESHRGIRVERGRRAAFEHRHVIFLIFSEVSNEMKLIARANAYVTFIEATKT
jgi:hypothetical protein